MTVYSACVLAASLFIALAQEPAPVKGIHPLTDATLAEAIKAGETPGAYLYSTQMSTPLGAITQGVMQSGDVRIKQLSGAPYSIRFLSPYIRAMVGAAEAKRKFEDRPAETAPSLNSQMVIISIGPSTDFTNLETIENVVIQRDGQTIRPIKAEVRPTVVQNRMGASAASAEGSFVFDFSAFQPTTMTTFVLIGRGGNFEFTLTSAELGRLR